VGKYIGFWQAAVQTRIWLPIKNAATAYLHTYVITVPHFCLSVSNSTAYWLYCINNYMQPQLCSMPRHSSAIGYRSVSTYGDTADETYVWTIHTDHCLDTLCWSNSTAERAYKIATMQYLAAAKLELTDTVAI